jgi:hypothetical protein
LGVKETTDGRATGSPVPVTTSDNTKGRDQTISMKGAPQQEILWDGLC